MEETKLWSIQFTYTARVQFWFIKYTIVSYDKEICRPTIKSSRNINIDLQILWRWLKLFISFKFMDNIQKYVVNTGRSGRKFSNRLVELIRMKFDCNWSEVYNYKNCCPRTAVTHCTSQSIWEMRTSASWLHWESIATSGMSDCGRVVSPWWRKVGVIMFASGMVRRLSVCVCV